MTATKDPPPVHVRGLDPEVWRAIRADAVRRGISVAELIGLMWERWKIEALPKGN